MRRSFEAGNSSESADTDLKTHGFAARCVKKQQSSRPVRFQSEHNGAKCVKNGSIVPRSGIVKTSRETKLLDAEMIVDVKTDLDTMNSITGEIQVFMLDKNRKQTMRNSSELAKSHRRLTVNVEANPPKATAETLVHKAANFLSWPYTACHGPGAFLKPRWLTGSKA